MTKARLDNALIDNILNDIGKLTINDIYKKHSITSTQYERYIRPKIKYPHKVHALLTNKEKIDQIRKDASVYSYEDLMTKYNISKYLFDKVIKPLLESIGITKKSERKGKNRNNDIAKRYHNGESVQDISSAHAVPISHVEYKIKKVKRNDEIIAHYKNGETLENIGEEFKITRERVRQIVKQNNAILNDRSVIRTAKKLSDILNDEILLNEIKKCNDDGMGLNQIQKRYGLYNETWKIVKDKLGLKIHRQKRNYHNDIINLYRQGHTYKQIADIVNLSKSYVNKQVSFFIAKNPTERRRKNTTEGETMENEKITSLDDAMKLIQQQQQIINQLTSQKDKISEQKIPIEINLDEDVYEQINDQSSASAFREAINNHLDTTIQDLKKIGFSFENNPSIRTKKYIYKADWEKIQRGEVTKSAILSACMRKYINTQSNNETLDINQNNSDKS